MSVCPDGRWRSSREAFMSISAVFHANTVLHWRIQHGSGNATTRLGNCFTVDVAPHEAICGLKRVTSVEHNVLSCRRYPHQHDLDSAATRQADIASDSMSHACQISIGTARLHSLCIKL